MGNNQTLPSLYAAPPPNLLTPLSSDKYFCITSSATSTTGNNGGVTISSRRVIPVVYISSREERSDSIRNDDDILDESRCDENDRRHSSLSSKSSRYTILYCHGHDVDLGSIYDHLVTLSALLNVDIVSFEYDGYGLSLKCRGSTTAAAVVAAVKKKVEPPSHEAQCNADIQICYNYLVRNRRISPHNIILYGKSVGSGPACWLADLLYQKMKVAMTNTKSKENSRKTWKSPPLGGLVLHSAHVSNPCGFGLSISSTEYYNNLPVYLIHGTEDNVIPIQHSIKLYNQFVVQHQHKSFPPFWANGTFFLYCIL